MNHSRNFREDPESQREHRTLPKLQRQQYRRFAASSIELRGAARPRCAQFFCSFARVFSHQALRAASPAALSPRRMRPRLRVSISMRALSNNYSDRQHSSVRGICNANVAPHGFPPRHLAVNVQQTRQALCPASTALPSGTARASSSPSSSSSRRLFLRLHSWCAACC